MLVSNARIVKTSIDLNVQISMDVGTAASSQGKLDGGSCQNYGPFLGTLNTRCRIILRTKKGTLILTTTHVIVSFLLYCYCLQGLLCRVHKGCNRALEGSGFRV